MKPLEPSIPEHLRVPRTHPVAAPPGFVPDTPNFSARFDVSVRNIPMAFFGVQDRRGGAAIDAAAAALEARFSGQDAPKFWDRAEYIDELGHGNAILVGYWDDLRAYLGWLRRQPPGWWHAGASLDGELGFFRECYTPGITDTETTFSHPFPEGYARIADRMSGDTDTHGYWGSARDRLPRAQTETLGPVGRPTAALAAGEETLGRHIVVQPHENLCLLRSGQDWSEARDHELALYVGRVRPHLESGMRELSDRGREFGCYFNRYMHCVGPDAKREKTYSLSAWHSLADLESWCRGGTHLRIFAAGTQHYRALGTGAMLRLYHEMSVMRAQDQSFEYFNCHRRTGMLNAVAGRADGAARQGS